MKELLTAIHSSSPEMLLSVFLLGIQSGVYIFQFSRILVLAGYLFLSEQRGQRLRFLLLFCAGTMISILLLGVVLAFYPHFNILISRYTPLIYLLLGMICLIWGIIISGLTRFDEEVLFSLAARHHTGALWCAFVLGILFSLLETPVCPSCGSNISIMASATFPAGHTASGIVLLLLYGAGECLIPALLGTLIIGGGDRYLSRNSLPARILIMLIGFTLILWALLFFWTS